MTKSTNKIDNSSGLKVKVKKARDIYILLDKLKKQKKLKRKANKTKNNGNEKAISVNQAQEMINRNRGENLPQPMISRVPPNFYGYGYPQAIQNPIRQNNDEVIRVQNGQAVQIPVRNELNNSGVFNKSRSSRSSGIKSEFGTPRIKRDDVETNMPWSVPKPYSFTPEFNYGEEEENQFNEEKEELGQIIPPTEDEKMF